jgi:membrane-associated protease RseP (regulator of RpoE activity)
MRPGVSNEFVPGRIASAVLLFTMMPMKTILTGLLVVFLGMGRMMAADAVDNGPVIGIGVGIHLADKHPVIDQVLPDQAAFKGGVKVGDRLLMIDGKSVEGVPLADISKMLRGAAGSRVHITILRPGEKSSRTFSLKRQVVTLPGSSLPKGP